MRPHYYDGLQSTEKHQLQGTFTWDSVEGRHGIGVSGTRARGVSHE